MSACGRPGCVNKGERICIICGHINYCSRRCQVDDWTAHQQTCRARYGAEESRVDVSAPLERFAARRTSHSSASTEKLHSSSSYEDFVTTASSSYVSAPVRGAASSKGRAFDDDDAVWEKQLSDISGMIKRDDFQGAIDRGEALLSTCDMFGLRADSPRLSALFVSLGLSYANVGDSDNAERCYKKAIQVAADADAVGVSTWLIGFYLTHDKVDRADAECRAHLAAARDLLGETDPSSISLLRLHGEILQRQGSVEEASAVFEKAYSLLQRIRVATDPEMQDTVRDLLTTLLALKRYTRAHEIALKNYSLLSGCDHSLVLGDLAMSGLKLAQVIMGMDGDLAHAYTLLEEAVTNSESVFGAESLQVAEALVSLAQIRKRRSQFDDETVSLLNRAHLCYESCAGPDDPNTLFTLKTIQKVRREQYLLQVNGSIA